MPEYIHIYIYDTANLFRQHKSVVPSVGLRCSQGDNCSLAKNHDKKYRQVANISRTLVCHKFCDHSGVVGASSVGAAPTTSSFST